MLLSKGGGKAILPYFYQLPAYPERGGRRKKPKEISHSSDSFSTPLLATKEEDCMEKKLEETFEEESEAEVENFVPYQNPTATKDEAIRLLEGCPICGCKLHFTNFSDFARMVSHEVVRCEECGYRAKKEMSILQ